MNERVTFCEECRRDVSYTIESVTLHGTLKGEEYEYVGEKALCIECGAEVYVREIEDANLKALYAIYREKNGIISLEDILEISRKYAIGKRPLSLLLGWGEMTFTRYCDGDIPTKQYSNILRGIYDDPATYLQLLDEKRDNLKSAVAYTKSKRATAALLGQHPVMASKMDDVAKYLQVRCEITPLALQKALYYVQGFHYAFMDEFVFAEDCEAWVHGPVYREIYNRYSRYGFEPIAGNEEFDASVFTEAEKAIIDSVIQNLCCYSGKVLERFTHSEMPWLKTRGDLPADAPCDRKIGKDVIGEYFAAVKTKHHMLSPSDIETYAQVMFQRLHRC